MSPMSGDSAPPVEVKRLQVAELARRSKHRLMLEMIHNGLGQPIRVPVMVARGERDGPVFGITAAVHGNELNGIPVIHRLFQRLDLGRLRGTIAAAVVVNVPGLNRHIRGFTDGSDLNHLMPGDAGGKTARVYARRFVTRFLHACDYLVDLHTASFGRVNSLYVRADMTDPTTARMAYLQRPEIIVHNPPSDRTLRGTAHARGIPAITVEVGNPQRFQPEYIRSTLIGLRRVLAEAGMIKRRAHAEGPPPVVCERSYWLRTIHGGLLEVFPRVTQRIEPGDVIARQTNAFGDLIGEYRAAEAGVVIGKSVDPVAQTGDRILHLGIIAADDRRFISRRATKGS